MFSAAVHTAEAAAKCPALKVSPNSQNAASAKPALATAATAWQTRSSRRSASIIRACSVPFFFALWQARGADVDPPTFVRPRSYMKPMSEPRRLDRWDLGVCVALAAGYLTLLLSTVHDLGYARDEGFYFQA